MVVDGARAGIGTAGGRDGCGAAAGRAPLPSNVAGLRCGRPAPTRSPTGGINSPEISGAFLGGSWVIGWPSGPYDLHQEQETDRVLLKASHHGFKHVEGLFLVGNQRILLTVSAQDRCLP